MKTSELNDRVYPGLLQTESHQGVIIAAGPITKQPGTLPLRIVLVDTGDGYAVWTQIFQDLYRLPDGTLWPVDNGTFNAGTYFQPGELAEATQKFGELVANSAHFIKSIYREDAKFVA